MTLQGFPLGLRHSSPGEKWPLPLQDARTNPEPGLREPTIFVRVKSLKIVRVQPVASTKPSPDPERLPPEERQLLPAGLSSGRLSLYPEEGRSPHTKENTQQESREPATVKEPSGMLGITHVESSSSAIPLRDSEFSLPDGRWLPSPDLSTGRQLMPPRKRQPIQVQRISGQRSRGRHIVCL